MNRQEQDVDVATKTWKQAWQEAVDAATDRIADLEKRASYPQYILWRPEATIRFIADGDIPALWQIHAPWERDITDVAGWLTAILDDVEGQIVQAEGIRGKAARRA